MTVLIRFCQILFALMAVNGAYGVAVQLGLREVLGDKKPSLWNILGSVVSVVACCLLTYLLQLYYMHRSGRQISAPDKQRFVGMALGSVGIAMGIGFGVVVLLAAIALSNL